MLTGKTTVILASPTVTAAEVTVLSNWVNAGGNLIAMRPDKKLAPLLGLTDAERDPAQRLHEGRHRHGRGRGHRGADDAVPRHRRPLHAQRRQRDRLPVLQRDHGADEPGRHDARRRQRGRPGGGVHVRPRPLDRLHPPGQPGVGRRQARRHRRLDRRHAPDRPLLRPQGRRHPAQLGRHGQDRRPAGRRAAAPAGEHDHGDEPGQGPDAAVLVPAARREGRGHHDRRRPRLRRDGPVPQPHEEHEPGGLLGGRVGVHPQLDVRLQRHAGHRRADEGLPGRRLRDRPAPQHLLRLLHAAALRPAALEPARDVQVHLAEHQRPAVQPHALRRSGAAGPRSRRASGRRASASTRTTTTRARRAI